MKTVFNVLMIINAIALTACGSNENPNSTSPQISKRSNNEPIVVLNSCVDFSGNYKDESRHIVITQDGCNWVQVQVRENSSAIQNFVYTPQDVKALDHSKTFHVFTGKQLITNLVEKTDNDVWITRTDISVTKGLSKTLIMNATTFKNGIIVDYLRNKIVKSEEESNQVPLPTPVPTVVTPPSSIPSPPEFKNERCGFDSNYITIDGSPAFHYTNSEKRLSQFNSLVKSGACMKGSVISVVNNYITIKNNPAFHYSNSDERLKNTIKLHKVEENAFGRCGVDANYITLDGNLAAHFSSTDDRLNKFIEMVNNGSCL